MKLVLGRGYRYQLVPGRWTVRRKMVSVTTSASPRRVVHRVIPCVVVTDPLGRVISAHPWSVAGWALAVADLDHALNRNHLKENRHV